MLELPENSAFAKGADFRFYIPEKYKKDFSQPEWKEIQRDNDILKILADDYPMVINTTPDFINKKGNPYYAVTEIKLGDLPEFKVLRKGNVDWRIGAGLLPVKNESQEFKQALDKVAGFDTDVDEFYKDLGRVLSGSVFLFYFRERFLALKWSTPIFYIYEIKSSEYLENSFFIERGIGRGRNREQYCSFIRKENVK
jgi:TusA-related sulfurtransferase